MPPDGGRRIAVALHDIAPARFERVALIRDWLADLGIDRATLLVIPAEDLHPLADRGPGLAAWLAERRAAGDVVAQHGFQHLRPGAGPAEFVGLDEADTRRALSAGRRVLHLAGVEPGGFVAPAYAYTGALQRCLLGGRYPWWAGQRRLTCADGRRSELAPALSLGRRATAPWGLRASALLAGDTIRLDVHPADLDRTANVATLEALLHRARDRRPVTYDDLARTAQL